MQIVSRVADPKATDSGCILTEAEAAQRLRLSARTLQRLRLDGGGPSFVQLTPSGSRIGYTIAALDAWTAARTVGSTSAATVAAVGSAK
jgi:hypothetical protein